MSDTTRGVGREALSYKFIAPAPYANAIRRDTILQRIEQDTTAAVVVLQAPAGHGKSTTLQQLKDVAESCGSLVAWLTFDDGDNDPRRFSLHMRSLGQTLLAQAGHDASLADARAGFRYGPDWLLESMSIIGRPVALFLDEFQTLTDPAVLSFFRDIFERAPRGVRFYIGSRALPNVGLARLIVNNRAMLLRGDDLRFSPEEVGRFFESAEHLGIDSDELGTIYQRTEGWPAALQLFRLTLASPTVRRSLGHDDTRAPREIAEYLAENVLALQKPRVQEFLLRTSKLRRLSAPLCDAVLGWSDSRDLIAYLESSGLFLRCVDPQSGWFKYHTLFSSILSAQLRAQDPEAANEVHRRAARWNFEAGCYEECVHHATVCSDYALAATALNRWSSTLIAGGQLRTVEYWFSRIPTEEIHDRVDLMIKCAYALVFLRRRKLSQPLLARLAALPSGGDVDATSDPNIVLSMAAVSNDDIPQAYAISDRVSLGARDVSGFPAFEIGAIANLRSYCALTSQDLDESRKNLALARVYNERVDAAFSHGYTEAMFGVLSILDGRLQDALDRFRSGLKSPRSDASDSVALAALTSCYIWALYEANELDGAEGLFTQHQSVVRASALPDFLTVAYLAGARVFDARGVPARADLVLEEAATIGREYGWSRLVSTILWERVRRALNRGASDEADRIAEAARADVPLPSHWIPFSGDLEHQELGEIRLALSRLELDEAGVRIDAELGRQRGRVLRQIRLTLLRSIHALRVGNPTIAQRQLRKALQLARPGGYVRTILDEGDEVLQLVREEYRILLDERRSRSAPSLELIFVEQLLAASGTDLGREPVARQALLQPLTGREREMLLMLGEGISNREIASRLFLSENTIKYHLKNVYAKLAVTSRVQALRTAKQIGII